MSEPVRGRGTLAPPRELEAIAPRGGTDLARAVDAVILRSPRPGMLVILSDFLDPGPFDAAIKRAASAGHDVALVQVLAREELEPDFEGDLAFEDAETGAVVEVTVDGRALDAYLARLASSSGSARWLRPVARRTSAR